MSITYSLPGPGYNDASLDYLGNEVAPITGSGAATISDPSALTAAEADESHSATVTIE